MKKSNIFYGLTLGVVFTVVGFSCAKKDDEAASSSRKLYIATGVCNSGTGFTAPAIGDVGKLITRLDISSRNYEVIRDYANLANEFINTYPASITDGGDGNIYVAVENTVTTGNRRIDKIVKTPFGNKVVWLPNSDLAAGGVLKGISRTTDKGILFGSTAAVERYDATPNRKTIGTIGAGNPWGSGFANDGAGRDCSANNTFITDIVALPSAVAGDEIGKFIYAHSANNQHDIGVISKNGAGTLNCLANAPGGANLIASASADPAFDTQLSPSATPTSIIYISTGTGTGKLLVAYSSNLANSGTNPGLNNALVMYDFTENTGIGETATLSNGTILYNQSANFAGVSAMAYDSTDNSLYVARVDQNTVVANVPSGFIIEKFTLDLTTPSATRVLDADSSVFEGSNTFNNCVTSMFVGE